MCPAGSVIRRETANWPPDYCGPAHRCPGCLALSAEKTGGCGERARDAIMPSADAMRRKSVSRASLPVAHKSFFIR